VGLYTEPDRITYKVKYPSGESFEATLHVYLGHYHWDFEPIVVLPPPDEPVVDPVADVLVELTLQFQDDSGRLVSSLKKGEEYWLQLSATDRRADPNGVFGAWIDLTFASEALSVVGSPEGIGEFQNSVQGELLNGDRIASLGAFSKELIFSRTASSEVARIRVRAETVGDLNLAVTPAANKLNEILLFGIDNSVQPTHIDFAIPEIEVVDPHDANADGRVSPLDALIVISHLTKIRQSAEGESPVVTTRVLEPTMQSRAAQMDISGDGNVSPVDVLLIIDFLNRRQLRQSADQSLGNGEASATQPALAIDAISSLAEESAEQSDSLVDALACSFLEHEESLRKSQRQTD
jgi:Dockerin type I domain